MSGMTPARTSPATEQYYSFSEAIVQALQGRRLRRVEWPEGVSIYFSIGQHERPGPGGILRICQADGTVNDLLVQDGDATATDWIVAVEH